MRFARRLLTCMGGAPHGLLGLAVVALLACGGRASAAPSFEGMVDLARLNATCPVVEWTSALGPRTQLGFLVAPGLVVTPAMPGFRRASVRFLDEPDRVHGASAPKYADPLSGLVALEIAPPRGHDTIALSPYEARLGTGVFRAHFVNSRWNFAPLTLSGDVWAVWATGIVDLVYAVESAAPGGAVSLSVTGGGDVLEISIGQVDGRSIYVPVERLGRFACPSTRAAMKGGPDAAWTGAAGEQTLRAIAAAAGGDWGTASALLQGDEARQTPARAGLTALVGLEDPARPRRSLPSAEVLGVDATLLVGMRAVQDGRIGDARTLFGQTLTSMRDCPGVVQTAAKNLLWTSDSREEDDRVLDLVECSDQSWDNLIELRKFVYERRGLPTRILLRAAPHSRVARLVLWAEVAFGPSPDDAAAREFERRPPGDPYSLLRRAILAIREGKPEAGAALAAELASCAGVPSDMIATAEMYRSRALSSLGDKDGATRASERAVEADPESKEASERLCRFLALAERWEDAIDRCEQHVRRWPAALEVRGELAMLYALKGRQQAALAELDAIQLWRGTTNSMPWGEMGRAYLTLRRPVEALDAFEENLRVWPTDDGALAGAARCEIILGDFDAARGHIEQLRERAPDSAVRLEQLLEAAEKEDR